MLLENRIEVLQQAISLLGIWLSLMCIFAASHYGPKRAFLSSVTCLYREAGKNTASSQQRNKKMTTRRTPRTSLMFLFEPGMNPKRFDVLSKRK